MNWVNGVCRNVMFLIAKKQGSYYGTGECNNRKIFKRRGAFCLVP